MRKVGLLVGLLISLSSFAAFAQEPTPNDEETLNASLQADPHGYSAEAVGRRAAETSYQAEASRQTLRGAAARVDAAWAGFLPRLSAIGQYERLSDITLPSLIPGGGGIVTYTGPCASMMGPACQIPAGATLYAVPFSFPILTDNWLFQATLSVPISDYFLRINQNYTAATHSRDAARFDLLASRTKAASDGITTFYTWLRAKGTLVVAKLALDDQKTHLNDTRNLFTAGQATQVDVLRGETAVAAAELTVVQVQNLVQLADKQVRIAMHLDDQAPLSSSETLDATAPPPVNGTLATLIGEGQSQRFELRSLDANSLAQRQAAKVQRAGVYPAFTAFGDLIEANPNPRIIPAQQYWFASWDVGIKLTWSPNDIPTALAGAADAESRAANLLAQQKALRDNIAIEVTQAYQAVQEADFSLGSTAKQLASAREAVRVARELFRAGRVNSTTLTDAETELTRARLAVINARIDTRTARVRLDHALGRDNRLISTAP